MNLFLAGAITMGYWAAGLFFFRFYRRTLDRLFLIFAFAFWILAFERIILAMESMDEFRPFIYLLRLSAFSLIIYAVIDKNRQTPKEPEV